MSNNRLICKDNRIIEASYRLTLTEQRIILFAISQVNSLEKLNEGKIFFISASAYSSMFGVDKNEAFREMKDAMDALSERWVKVIDDGDEKRSIRWVSEKSSIISNQTIEICFTSKIAPYLSELKGTFTRYQLTHVSSMKSAYSIRLYEMLMQWKKTRTKTVTLDQLRDRLQLTSKAYATFGNIRLKVIDPAMREITLCSDIIASYEAIKEGRKVVSIKFMFSFKPGMDPKTASKKEANSALAAIKNKLTT